MMDYISLFLPLTCLCRLPRPLKVLLSFWVPSGVSCGSWSALDCFVDGNYNRSQLKMVPHHCQDMVQKTRLHLALNQLIRKVIEPDSQTITEIGQNCLPTSCLASNFPLNIETQVFPCSPLAWNSYYTDCPLVIPNPAPLQTYLGMAQFPFRVKNSPS